MDPISALDQAISRAPAAVAAVDSLEGLATLESSLLGKESPVGEVRRRMATLDPLDKPRVGSRLNEAAEIINQLLTARRAELEDEDEGRRLLEESIDVTLESVTFPTGS
ncbi:MAG: phenylalanine--tRNA ligase subunit alpha, partial [Acidimicrobiia bacterium]